MSKQRVTNYYAGLVQGVGFRYTVRMTATEYDVVGAVRNLEDGRVQLIAEGHREELEDFLVAVRQSEIGRFIRQEQTQWSDAKNEFRGFEITH